MRTANILTEFSHGLNEINLVDGDETPSVSRGQRIKGTFSSIYDMSALGSGKGDIWNWGMYDEDLAREIGSRIPNFDKFDTDGFSEQLYFLALRQIPADLDDYAKKSILEVGCGLGEGLNFISRISNASNLIGLDLSGGAIERAIARLSRGSNLRFVQGDAEKLPFDNNELDVVINVESSHLYPDLGRFFEEVERVLKPGGYFSHIDLFTRQRHDLMTRLKQECQGLQWIHERDISEQVRAAISRRMSPGSFFRKTYEAKRMPFLARRLGGRYRMIVFGARFAGYQDSPFSGLLKKAGVLPKAQMLPVETYRHYVAKKV